MSTIKVDTIATRTGSGNITVSNSLASATVAGDLTVDTNTLKVNASTNRVGIGTVSPPQKFVVSNAGADNIVMAENSSASIQMFMQAQSGVGAVGTLTNHDTVFLSNNSEKGRFLAGGGLTFNGDTAAANALDDYEEGTSQVSVSGVTASTNTVSMNYVKVGSLVHIIGEVLISGKSGNSGNANFPLPFTPSATYSFTSTVGATIHYNTISSSIHFFGLYGGNASVYGNNSGTYGNNYINGSSWTDGRIGFTLTYTTF